MSMIYNFAQQGTIFVIAADPSNPPTTDVNLTLNLADSTEIWAPYVIRQNAIVTNQRGGDSTSFLEVFPCDSHGYAATGGAVLPITDLQLNLATLSVNVAFSTAPNSQSNIAGFGVKICVWSTQAMTDESNVNMTATYGSDNTYVAKFVFDNAGSSYAQATGVLSTVSPVPWGNNAPNTATGMGPGKSSTSSNP